MRRFIGRELRRSVAELDAALPRGARGAADICDELERGLAGVFLPALSARATVISEEGWSMMLVLPRALLRLAARRIRAAEEARDG